VPADRPPVPAALATLACGATWATGFLIESSIPMGSRWLLGLGTWLLTLVVLAGLLIARSRWSTRMAMAVAAVAIPGVVIIEGRTVLVAVGAATAAATVAAATRAVSVGAVRPFRAADAPPDDAVVLMLLGVAGPLVLGLGSLPDGPSTITAVAAIILPMGAWWFGRVSVPALWAHRLAVPVVTVAGGVTQGLPGGVAGVALGAAIAWYAWRPAVRLAADPLAPTKVDAKPVFAEFAPREVRDAAGIDERGRR
jgi:hypothetical protein